VTDERKAIVLWARNKASTFHGFARDADDHLRTQHIALSSAYGTLADAIERGDHLEKPDEN